MFETYEYLKYIIIIIQIIKTTYTLNENVIILEISDR